MEFFKVSTPDYKQVVNWKYHCGIRVNTVIISAVAGKHSESLLGDQVVESELYRNLICSFSDQVNKLGYASFLKNFLSIFLSSATL